MSLWKSQSERNVHVLCMIFVILCTTKQEWHNHSKYWETLIIRFFTHRCAVTIITPKCCCFWVCMCLFCQAHLCGAFIQKRASIRYNIHLTFFHTPLHHCNFTKRFLSDNWSWAETNSWHILIINCIIIYVLTWNKWYQLELLHDKTKWNQS